MKTVLYITIALVTFASNAQIKILFDATKAESAGNADWVIDADSHNLGFTSGPAVVGSGNESNPQRVPTPAQSGISTTTAETYWNGGLSNWAIDCVKQGYVVETLPVTGQITYGVSTNVQDLSNYKVFVVDEPNISFTASEKVAILHFVQNGGGLCIISDHTISDRNNDGVDSPQVLNDLMTNNTVQNNPFGITYDYTDISETSTNIATLPTNPILHGVAGNVAEVKWSNGATMTLSTTQNPSATGLVYKTGSSATGATNILCASAVYQNGKVVAIGDSSIADDGTGDGGDTLYNGYTLDANGNHQKLLMNAIIWLASSSLGTASATTFDASFVIAPNPIQRKELNFNYIAASNDPFAISIYDVQGRIIKVEKLNLNENNFYTVPLPTLASGIYFCQIVHQGITKTVRFMLP